MSQPASAAPHGHAASSTALVLGAIGIVFGDIGTSPLYTIQECVGGPHGVAATPDHVLGILSLIFWSLMLVVTLKYLALLMRADNQGEGGIFALLALVPEPLRAAPRGKVAGVSVLVIAGAALLFGDGIITPAISVLAAMEGLGVATDALKDAVVPLTCVILAGLFAIQRLGTGKVGKFFGPVMVVWFVTIASLGTWQIVKHPAILAALSPHHGAQFLWHNGFHGFRLLGSVVLAVTGGEALYADMGHFGRAPIQRAWLALVLPALVLCYFGQGALLLAEPAAAAQPFFGLVPKGWATFALVGLAAPATVIASQALISGVFSLTHQAVRMGYFPRVQVLHTASDAEGQIYVPAINWLLAVSCIALVLAFGASSKLAAAFGLAVSGTMAITSVVFYVVLRQTWHWSIAKALPLLLLFLTFDLAFLGANLLKFFDGGYLPLAVGALFFVGMLTWRRGRSLLSEHMQRSTVPLPEYERALDVHQVVRVPGAGVFLTSNPTGTPSILTHLMLRTHALPKTVVLFSATTEHVPYVPATERLRVDQLGSELHRVVARYGFMDQPDVARDLRDAVTLGLPVVAEDVTWYLGRETFVLGERGAMGPVAEGIYAVLSRNARNASL